MSKSQILSEMSYHRFIDGIVDLAVYMLEIDGTIVSWNNAAQKIKGYQSDEIIGQNFSCFYTKKDIARGEPQRTLALAIETGKFEGEGWRVRKDGTRFWASLILAPIHDADDILIGFVKITRDISERSIKSDQRQLIIDADANGMLLIDEAGTITLASPYLENTFSYPTGSVLGLPIERLLTGSTILHPIYNYDNTSTKENSSLLNFCSQEELTGHRQDGTTFPVDMKFNPVSTARGIVVVASIVDITERKRSEAEMFETIRLWTSAKIIADEAKATAIQEKIIADEEKETAAEEKLVADVAKASAAHAKTIADEEKEIAAQAKIIADVDKATAAYEKIIADEEKKTAAEEKLVADVDKAAAAHEKIIADEEKATAAEAKLIADVAKATAAHEKIIADEEKATAAQAKIIADVAKALALEIKVVADEEKALAAKQKIILDNANRLLTMAEEMAHYGHWRIDLALNEVYWSEEVCRIHGVPITYRPSFENALAKYEGEGPDVAAMVQKASIDGNPFSYEARILRPDKTLRDVRCRGQAERASDGTLTGLVGIFQDITERKDAERIRNTLAERTVVSTQADKVGAWELDIIKNSLTWDTVMYGLYDQIESNITPSYDLWAQSITDEDRDRVTAEFGQAISGKKQFNTMFRILLPNGETRSIRAQATVLRNAANEPERMVGINWDITEIRSLADQIRNEQAALNALELEKLYQHERQWSTTFQRAVLPVALPSVIGCSFDAVYEPGLSNTTAGGDWYDAIHLSDGRILVSIGDVSGSGLQAAVVVGVVRQIIRGISQLHADPMIILDAADRALCLEYPEVYVSAWVGLIDLVTRTITYASAGHPAPLLVSKSGTVRELDDPSTTLMGLRKGHKGQPSTVRLDQGDTLVLYTDGLTEAGRDVVAGNKSLHDAAILIETAHGPAPAKSIRRQVIPDGSNDDVAILVVRTDYEEAERHIDRWTFAIHDGDAARQVRNNFVASLKKQLFSFDACANAELVFGELIGNVVRHASSTMNVEVAVNHAGPDTVLHVMDLGGGFNHASRLPRDPYAEAGRGLFLIAALTEDFTVSERPDGGSHARAVLLRNTP